MLVEVLHVLSLLLQLFLDGQKPVFRQCFALGVVFPCSAGVGGEWSIAGATYLAFSS